MENKKYNVVLSGGGARGFAHIGALEALFEKGLQVNAVSATSAGALVGIFLCDGYKPQAIREIILNEQPKISINIWGFWNGLLSFDHIKELLEKYIRSKTFDQLKIPLYVTATDLRNGAPHVFNEGKILDALLAASAIPAMFPPVVINNVAYADGGLSSNLPAEPFYSDPHKILGIYVNPLPPFAAGQSVGQQADRAAHLMIRHNVRENQRRCHVFVEPEGLTAFHMFDTKHTGAIIKAGYDYVMQHVHLE